jgi:hypothetical protein
MEEIGVSVLPPIPVMGSLETVLSGAELVSSMGREACWEAADGKGLSALQPHNKNRARNRREINFHIKHSKP